MVKTLKRIGNSQGLLIEKPILELLQITMDTPLEITTDGQRLIITPITENTSRKNRIKALNEKVTNQHEDTFRKLSK